MSDDDPRPLPQALGVAGELIPSVGGAFVRLLERAWEADMRRVDLLEKEVLAQVSTETIAAAIGDERRAQLITMAARAVGLSAWAGKRQAMARVMITALTRDDAVLDDSEMLVIAFMDLERHHFRLLARLVAHGVPALTSELEKVAFPVHPAALAGLVRHGAVEQQSAIGGLSLRVTEFGHTLLALVPTED